MPKSGLYIYGEKLESLGEKFQNPNTTIDELTQMCFELGLELKFKVDLGPMIKEPSEDDDACCLSREEQDCIDIFYAYKSDEILELPGAVQRFWKLGRDLCNTNPVKLSPGEERVASQLLNDFQEALQKPSPAEQSCIDIFKDFSLVEIKSQANSVKYAWKVGNRLSK